MPSAGQVDQLALVTMANWHGSEHRVQEDPVRVCQGLGVGCRGQERHRGSAPEYPPQASSQVWEAVGAPDLFTSLQRRSLGRRRGTGLPNTQ